MKLKTLSSALVLLAASCLAFTIKPAKRVNIIWFTLNSGIQEPGFPATIWEAQTNGNYTYFGTSAPSPSISGTYLYAIAVDADKEGETIDLNETPEDLTDDFPNVSSTSTDIHAALNAAHNNDGTWSNKTSGFNNAQIRTKYMP